MEYPALPDASFIADNDSSGSDEESMVLTSPLLALAAIASGNPKDESDTDAKRKWLAACARRRLKKAQKPKVEPAKDEARRLKVRDCSARYNMKRKKRLEGDSDAQDAFRAKCKEDQRRHQEALAADPVAMAAFISKRRESQKRYYARKKEAAKLVE